MEPLVPCRMIHCLPSTRRAGWPRHVAEHDQDEYIRHFAKQAIQQIEETVQEAQSVEE